ncbi:ATP-binding protein [Methanoculleus sp.]|uniref:ATP-binding protein n=1 Tax=Methanoculleus sp. TaxID=90427 RepID=UPI0025D89F43|nr:ATP-binding protein [Methanoculleus sp.]
MVNNCCDFDSIRNFTIGTLTSVSPNEWKVLLEHDAPSSTAINTGTPTLFPKINGYVLVPNESGALIGMISWIGIEQSQYPKRKGFKDFDLIDLPFPQRVMLVTPMGELRCRDDVFKVERGVFNYPSVGDIVILPTKEQLEAIVENKDGRANFRIGVAPTAANCPVYVNPDKLFGRHLAVLGNTGSGKSSSIVGIIRWSIEKAKQASRTGNVNARFIILDPNGEYAGAFDNLSRNVRKFRVKIDTDSPDFRQLRVPAWLWNSYEWIAITDASGKTQKPLLRQALRELKSGGQDDNTVYKYGRFYAGCQIGIRSDLAGGPSRFKGKPGKNDFGKKLASICKDLETDINDCKHPIGELLSNLLIALNNVRKRKYRSFNNDRGEFVEYYDDFEKRDVEEIISAFEEFLSEIEWTTTPLGPDEDSPISYDVASLPDHIERLSQEKSAQQYLDFFIMRIRTMLTDSRMSSIISTAESETLEEWLETYIGSENADNGEIAVIDLSLVPSDVIHLIVAVISRIIFESLQRYRRYYGKELPTVMVIDEAHTFIKKYYENQTEFTPLEMCCKIFEKIAREGRKYGLGLLISSQRPAELSPTVLSQCNTFLLHRLVNDKDQELVKKFVPDNLGSLLKELPVLPTRKAILLGWASPIPILVEVDELEEKYRPKSSDPSFWSVWTQQEERELSWPDLADEWQKGGHTEV